MNKAYHPNQRRLVMACVLLGVILATLFAIRRPLQALVRTHAALLFSGSRGHFATADARAAWAAEHPGELRVALVGEPSDARLAAFERTLGALEPVGGRKLVPVRVDPPNTPDGLQVALTRLAVDPSYFAVFAAFSADELLAVKPILLQGRLITFVPGVTNVRATQADEIPYVFLPNVSDAEIAVGLADMIAQTKNPSLLVCHEDSEEGRGLGEELQKAFQMRYIRRFIRIPLARDVLKMPVRHLVKEACDFHSIDNVAYIRAENSEDWDAVTYLLKTMPGKVVLAHPVEGDWTDEDRSRFVILSQMPHADAVAARSIWLFADAVAKTKRLHPDAVCETLCEKELTTPTGTFRFTPARFERLAP